MQTLMEWILIAILILASFLLRGLAVICHGSGRLTGYLEYHLPLWITAVRFTARHIKTCLIRSWEVRTELLLEQKDPVYDLGYTY